jgi:hypothetical protein
MYLRVQGYGGSAGDTTSLQSPASPERLTACFEFYYNLYVSQAEGEVEHKSVSCSSLTAVWTP